MPKQRQRATFGFDGGEFAASVDMWLQQRGYHIREGGTGGPGQPAFYCVVVEGPVGSYRGGPTWTGAGVRWSDAVLDAVTRALTGLDGLTVEAWEGVVEAARFEAERSNGTASKVTFKRIERVARWLERIKER